MMTVWSGVGTGTLQASGYIWGKHTGLEMDRTKLGERDQGEVFKVVVGHLSAIGG